MTAVLYTGPDCAPCRSARQWLLDRGMDFEERCVTDPKTRRELLAITGKTTVPVLELTDGDLLIGWNPKAWARRLDPEAAAPDGGAVIG